MEGKKKYFALIIFLFLGLMIFTFANPAEEEKEFKGGDKDQSETVTNKREDTTEEDDDEDEQEQQQEANQQQNVTTNNNQGNAQGGNQGNNPGQTPVNPVDNTLRDALAAVEKAEGTYTQNDVNAAKDLVNNVTDTTEKGKLEERLEEVEAGIAALALLENLENQVEEADEKADMTNATSYRDTNEIAKKIEDLNNETVKETLQERLDKVSKLLDDNAAPTTKVEAKVYNDNVEITAEDEAGNPFKMYLTKGNGKEKEISSGDKTTSDGVYTLRLIDEAFNEQTVTFTVDTTAPVLKDLTSGAHYPEITLTVEDLTKTKIEVTNMDKNETTEVEDGTKLTEDATYKVILTDEAGNTAEYWLAIDSLKPTISVKDEVVEDNAFINENTEVKVFDKFLTNVSITYEDAKAKKTTEEFTRVDFTVGERNENFTLTYELTKVGTYTITGTDKYGNEKTVTVEYDKVFAGIKSANMYSNGKKYNTLYYATNGSTITAYIRVKEQLKEVPTFTFKVGNTTYVAPEVKEAFHNADDKAAGIYRYQTTIKVADFNPENGDVSFVVSNIQDKAGNKGADVTAVTNKNVVRVDRTAPKSQYVAILSNKTENHKYVTNGQLVRVLAAFDEEINVTDKFVLTINGKNYKFQRSQDTTKYEYIVEFRIPASETSMPEGEIQFAISGYEDFAGNTAEPLTKANHYKYNTLTYDRTSAEIILPGQEGEAKNQYRILQHSYIALEYLEAKVNDNIDGEATILPTKFYAYYPKTTGIPSKAYTLEDNDGEKYFDTSMIGVNYEVQYEYIDKTGNKAKKSMLLIVDAPYKPEIANDTINVKYDLLLNDKPFYNDKERNAPLTINGNGNTITQEIDTNYKYTWDITGTRPMQSNMFTSANNSLVTVNDLNFAGSIYSITLGHYRSSNQGGFTTVLNNVNVINTKVASFSGGLSPAMSIYGKATLNNVNVYGTTLSELDTNPKWPVYDVIMVNNTDTTINGGKIGTIFTWPKAYLEINNAEIGTIDTQIEYRTDYTKAGLVIGENTKVEKIIIKENKAVLTVKSTAEVGVLDLCAQDISEMKLNFEAGAKIDKIILKDGDSCKEMSFDEWYKSVYPITVNSVDEFKTALSEGYRNIILAKTLDIVGNQKLSATKQTKVTTVDKITMFNIAEGQSLTLENIILDGENKYKVDVTKAATMHNDPFNVFGEYPTEQTRVYAATSLINSNGTLTLGAGTVIRNYAHQPVSPQYGGPAISVTGGSVVINGLEFTNNVSQLLTAKNATVTINNINVHDTWATGNKAGLIEINTGATMDVNNGTFKNNMMSMRSAGLFIANGGTINMKGGHYENNASTRNGSNTSGSLFVVETTGKIYMTGGTIINNIGYRAGAFSSRWTQEGSVVELNGGTIKNNTTRNADFKNASIFARSYFKIGKDMIIEDKVVADTATAVIDNYGKIVGDVEVTNINGKFNNHGTVTGTITVPQP